MEEQKKRPSSAQVDALIAEYADAQKVVVAAKTAASVAQGSADKLKERLVEWIKSFGRQHAKKSMRLVGTHNKATATFGATTTTDADAVDELHDYLEEQELVELEGKLFVKHVSYTLVASPDEVLKHMSLPARIRAKVTKLLNACTKTITKAPSLKIDVAEVQAATGKSKAA